MKYHYTVIFMDGSSDEFVMTEAARLKGAGVTSADGFYVADFGHDEGGLLYSTANIKMVMVDAQSD